MLNVLIAGVGGQGSVLAAKILAQAALKHGWQVRTAETIGMAQRGGNVTSHVRMGDAGECVNAPLVAKGTADVIIALEPGEGLRALPYLVKDGLMVCATTPIPSVMADLSGETYRTEPIIEYLASTTAHFCAVDDAAICDKAGSRKVLNVAMLAVAVQLSAGVDYGLRGAIGIDELKEALKNCVKERFIALNCESVDIAVEALRKA
jgi:indolepyruvate ferredoxin oxidoreductase beta subunit